MSQPMKVSLGRRRAICCGDLYQLVPAGYLLTSEGSAAVGVVGESVTKVVYGIGDDDSLFRSRQAITPPLGSIVDKRSHAACLDDGGETADMSPVLEGVDADGVDRRGVETRIKGSCWMRSSTIKRLFWAKQFIKRRCLQLVGILGAVSSRTPLPPQSLHRLGYQLSHGLSPKRMTKATVVFRIHLHKTSAIKIFQQEGRTIFVHDEGLLAGFIDAAADLVAVVVGDIGAALGLGFVGKIVSVVLFVESLVQEGLFEFIIVALSPLQIVTVAGSKRVL